MLSESSSQFQLSLNFSSSSAETFSSCRQRDRAVQSILLLNFSNIWTLQKMLVLPETSFQSSLSAYFSSCASLNGKSPETLPHASVSIIWATTPSHKLIFSILVLF